MNIQEVAKQAGVSIATVSRVVNGNQAVKEAKRKLVQDAIEYLKYVPDEHARILARKQKEKKVTHGDV